MSEMSENAESPESAAEEVQVQGSESDKGIPMICINNDELGQVHYNEANSKQPIE